MIRRLLRASAGVLWCLPGFLLWAAFPPMGEKTEVVFALAPLLWLSRNCETRTAVRRWFLNGLVFWVATLQWMPAIVKNGGPWPLVVLGWGALSAYCAAYFAAFGYLSSKVWGFVRGRGYGWRLGALIVAEPVLWAGLELLRSRLFGGFAWNQLGVVPAVSGFGAPAAFGGVYLLSMAVVLVNGTLASLADRVLAPWLRTHPRTLHLEGGTVEVAPEGADRGAAEPPRWARSVETFLPFAIVWCIYQLPPPAPQTPAERLSLQVALVQRNFPCVFEAREESPVDVYTELLANVSPLKPELVVLPESAYCEVGRFGTRNALRFAGWMRAQTGSDAVLAGGMRIDGGREYNSAALFQDGDDVQVYDKVHLVPFGEYIPGDKWITALQRLAPVGSCTPGELKTLELRRSGIKLGVAICFEDTDSAQMRRLAAMGAEALVFMTNDSWFSRSDEPVQHVWQAVARALETGLPVIRVGNSGVTGVVSPDGRATWLAGQDGRPLVDMRGAMVERVEIAANPTPAPYVRLGDLPLFVAFVLLIGGMILVKYAHNHEKRR